MCGRFTNKMTWQEIHDLYDLTNDDFRPNIRPNYNVAPTQMVPVIKAGHELAIMRWGFERHWAKSTIINATAEKVATSNVFKKAFNERRCLVPADGFYEWKKGKDGKRQPYRITLTDEEPFAFAGIWETWKADKDGYDFTEADEVETFCIVTTRPNELLKPIHNRMPMMLDKDTYDAWLDGLIDEDGLTSFPASRMTAYRVGTRVNSVKNNDAECVTPL